MKNQINLCLKTLLVITVTFCYFTFSPVPSACGALWQDLFPENSLSEPQKTVQFGLGYSQGRGIFIHTFEETPVKVVVDGTAVYASACLPELENILQDAGVELGKHDYAEFKLVTGEKNIPEIQVTRVKERLITEKAEIPYNTVKVTDARLEYGEQVVRSAGKEGIILKKYRVVIENGCETAREKIGEEIIREAEPQVIAVGGQITAAKINLASRDSQNDEEGQTLTMVATAYTHTGNPTASGVWPYVGGVAVDPRVIPLGSELYVEGYGPARAVDTGGLIKGKRIDLFFNTAEECLNWGKRQVKVYVLE